MTPLLGASEQDLRILYEHAGIGIARVGVDGFFRIVNPKMTEIFGYTSREFEKLRFIDLTHPDDIERTRGWIKAGEDNSLTTFRAEKKYIHKSGKTIYVNLVVNPVRDAFGAIQYFVSAFEDITDRKRADDLLRGQKQILELIAKNTPLKETLEQVAKIVEQIGPGSRCSVTSGSVSIAWPDNRAPDERDIELAEAAGQLAQTAIEKAEAEKVITEQQVKLVSTSKMAALGEMGGALAHEINNPLTVIHGNAVLLEMLAARNLLSPEDVTLAADRIKETALRVTKIVKGLRAFARDGEQDPLKTTSVREILEDALVLCRERFRNHGVSLVVEPYETELTVDCRAVEIGQVIVNLLSNAFDAVQGAREKMVKVTARKAGSNTLEIAIEDSGPGIPIELREKIMQPFFTTKAVGKGTGLGLSIASGIADSHGGTLRLDEQASRTRFVLTLPL